MRSRIASIGEWYPALVKPQNRNYGRVSPIGYLASPLTRFDTDQSEGASQSSVICSPKASFNPFSTPLSVGPVLHEYSRPGLTPNYWPMDPILPPQQVTK